MSVSRGPHQSVQVLRKVAPVPTKHVKAFRPNATLVSKSNPPNLSVNKSSAPTIVKSVKKLARSHPQMSTVPQNKQSAPSNAGLIAKPAVTITRPRLNTTVKPSITLISKNGSSSIVKTAPRQVASNLAATPKTAASGKKLGPPPANVAAQRLGIKPIPKQIVPPANMKRQTVPLKGKGVTIVSKNQNLTTRPLHHMNLPIMNRNNLMMLGGARRGPCNPDPYGLDELTAEDMAFIDDGAEDDTSQWLSELRGITGYDPSKFRGVHDEARESNHTMVAYEERLSEQIARREDFEEFKKAAMESSDDEED